MRNTLFAHYSVLLLLSNTDATAERIAYTGAPTRDSRVWAVKSFSVRVTPKLGSFSTALRFCKSILLGKYERTFPHCDFIIGVISDLGAWQKMRTRKKNEDEDVGIRTIERGVKGSLSAEINRP